MSSFAYLWECNNLLHTCSSETMWSTSSVMTVWWRAVANGLGFQRFELKLWRSAGAAARPHAWPFTLSRWSLLLAAFTGRVVDSSTESTRKSKTWATASVTTRASDWGTETSFTVWAHGTRSAPVICTAAARSTTTSTSTTSAWSVDTSMSSTAASHIITAARIKGISTTSTSTSTSTPTSLCYNKGKYWRNKTQLNKYDTTKSYQ